MDNLFVFFQNVQRLKRKQRKGWIAHQIRDSESTASHIFRTAIFGWILGRRKNLDIEKVIKMALVHDLCEVFTFDETPYDPLLPKIIKSPEDQKKANEILKNWPKFSLEQKKEKTRKKRQRESFALRKLLSNLPSALRQEMENIWLEFEKNISQEARFMAQIDKAENFLQGVEYWETYGTIQIHLWLRWAKQIFDTPLLIAFERAVERRFIERLEKRDEKMDKILDFLIDVGKLKKKVRTNWIFRKVADPEKIADHAFLTSLMAWVFSYNNKNLQQKKILKIALIHELSKIHFTRDSSFFYLLFPNFRHEIKTIIEEPLKFSPEGREETLKELKKMHKMSSFFSKKTKRVIFEQELQEERKSLEELLSLFPKGLKEEITGLWMQYCKGLSREGRFVQQIDILENFFQAIRYSQEDKNFPIKSWWTEIGEKIEEPLLLNFIASFKQDLPCETNYC